MAPNNQRKESSTRKNMVPLFKRTKRRRKRKINSIKSLNKSTRKNSNNSLKKVNSITAHNSLHKRNKSTHRPKIIQPKLYVQICLLKSPLKSFSSILTLSFQHQIHNLLHLPQSKMLSSTKPKLLLS